LGSPNRRQCGRAQPPRTRSPVSSLERRTLNHHGGDAVFVFGAAGHNSTMAELPNLDDVFKRLQTSPGYLGMLVLNAAGIPIKSSFTDTRMTSQHSALVSSLVLMGQRATNDLDKNNTLQCMRLRSIKYEMIISTDASYTMVVFQDSKRQ
jgi:dynein light chain roadblock-type